MKSNKWQLQQVSDVVDKKNILAFIPITRKIICIGCGIASFPFSLTILRCSKLGVKWQPVNYSTKLIARKFKSM